MTKKEFFGYCSCTWRYEQLKDKIKNANIDQLKEINYIHKNFPNNPKYVELDKLLKQRLGE